MTRRLEDTPNTEAEWACGHVAGAVCAECHRLLTLRANELADENLRFRAKYGAPPEE